MYSKKKGDHKRVLLIPSMLSKTWLGKFLNSSKALMELKKSLFDGFTIDVIRQYQRLNAKSSHIDNRAGAKSITNVSRLQCHSVQIERAKGCPACEKIHHVPDWRIVLASSFAPQ